MAMVYWMINQQTLGSGLALNMQQANTQTNDDINSGCTCVSPGFNELSSQILT